MQSFDLRHIVWALIPIVALLIPIIAIVGGFMARARSERVLHETIRQLSERGQSIPPELLTPRAHGTRTPGEPRSRGGPMRGGAINVGVGLALMLLFYAMRPGSWQWAIGCIPLFVGIARLIAWKFEPGANGR